MLAVAALAMPFFGLIFLGFACGKIMRYPEAGLQWMNFFIVYLALPALFIKLIAPTPLEELANWAFVLSTTACTFVVFALSFVLGRIITGEGVRTATMQAVAGAYSNIGYMGPGLTLAALGQNAIIPTALIFVFDSILLFTLVPLLMAFGSPQKTSLPSTLLQIVRRIVTHPFNIATAVAVVMAYFRFVPPGPIDTMITFLKNAAAPCALFTMGVTVALRPLRSMPADLPALLAVKMVLHPVLVWLVLSTVGGFQREWIFTAVLMAALPPALNVFVLANQYKVFVERASTAILAGTLISVFTVTGLLYLIANDLIPFDPLH
ncbi:AEC family transporter [uncultured Alsobacter sp.]|uniref:AEC family transporter n=1 Tax=uncultured Alsobacter sp. TaxID=1748258 RepID=UPI0025D7B6B3|nr:AEC family transporter [uncultured Alsobacter sp.]